MVCESQLNDIGPLSASELECESSCSVILSCGRWQDPRLHGLLRGFPGPVAWHPSRRRRLWLQGPDFQRSGREDQEAAAWTSECHRPP